ncbi:MAG: hypothetical protein JW867_05850 [Candidatus Omnitrophica bacterium]|nr:hypothetical protein [Candidatus Omnitrophota bacterium]
MKIKETPTQKVLSNTQINLGDFVINPYRGCEFSCAYCYCQKNKNINGDDFGNTLSIKTNAPEILKKELRFKKPERVLIGSTTECFQYKEEEYKITEQILSILNSHSIPYTILTKSHLIRNYLGLIKKNNKNKIYFTLNFSKQVLINIFEKKSSSLEERLNTISRIKDAGIDLRIHIGPFMPFISDLEEILKLVPNTINEIDVELYHHKQGNFKKILDLTKEHINTKTAENLATVYSSPSQHLAYASLIKRKIKELAKSYPGQFYFILADFNGYYNSGMDYQKPLIIRR